MRKKSLRNICFAVVLLLVIMAPAGFAAARESADGDFSTVRVTNSKTFFRQVRTAVDDDGFRVSGRLRLKGRTGSNVPDYIEISLLDREGRVIESRKVSYTPKILCDRGKRREARFSARFSETPPAGGTVRLSNID
ncbi:MAG: hypothetical protein GXO34_05560 [Deltaproteobacteria bacterium]|nr:hypothetical protein [Deltaproteobacteria bacterium]